MSLFVLQTFKLAKPEVTLSLVFLNNNFDDFNLTAVEKCSNFSPERAVEAQVEDGVEEAVEDAPVQAP